MPDLSPSSPPGPAVAGSDPATWVPRTIDVDGDRVVLRCAGPDVGARDPVLVLHDAGAESLDAPAWARLATQVPVVQVLLPGIGDSDPVPDGAGLPWVTDLLAGVLDRLADAPAVVVGTSLGGWFALETALAHPAAVAHVVLLDAAGLHAPPGYLLGLFADGQGQDGQDGLIGPLMARHGLDPADPAAAAPYVAGMTAAALCSWNPHTPHPSLLARLAGRRIPATVAWGADDALIPIAHGRALADALGAPLRVVRGAGHLLAVDAPDVVAQLVADVVAGLGGGDRLPSPAACPSTSTD